MKGQGLCAERGAVLGKGRQENGPGRYDDVSSKYNKLGVRARLEGLIRCSPVAATSANSQPPRASLHTHSGGFFLHTCHLYLVPIWSVGFHGEEYNEVHQRFCSICSARPWPGLGHLLSHSTAKRLVSYPFYR